MELTIPLTDAEFEGEMARERRKAHHMESVERAEAMHAECARLNAEHDAPYPYAEYEDMEFSFR